MITYARISQKFLESTINKNVYDSVIDSCYNLSAILADIDGYIPSNVAKQLSTISMVSPGILIVSGGSSTVNVGVLPEERFYSEVSGYAYSVYLSCTTMDLSIVNPGSAKDYSKLISLSTDLSPEIRDAIYCVYLESFALYLELVNLTSVMELISRSDITRMCNNIEWISTTLELVDSPNYELIEVLRDLERTLLYVASLSHIFSKTYNKDLEEYEQWVGGIEYE